MTKTNTRRALLSSVVALVLCFSMLLGTTFAWFTDSVTSANNIITSGNLDIELEYWTGTEWVDVSGKSDILTNTLWEPGATEVAYLRVTNAGSLTLKYKLGININSEKQGTNVNGEPFKLSDYIMFGVVEGVEGDTNEYASREDALAAVTDAKKISAGYTKSDDLVAGAAPVYLALVVYMPTEVGNVANYKTSEDANDPYKYCPQIDLGINVVATQTSAESDSFGSDYDKDAEYPIVVNGTKAADKELELIGGKVEVNIPDTAPAGDYALKISNKIMTNNVDEGTTEVSYDIDILKDGVKVSDDGTEYEISIFVGEGLDIAAVKHNGNDVASYNYDSSTGIVTFKTTSFSPFSVVYKNVVNTAADIQTVINNAEDGSLITIEEGTYNLSAQIQIDNKSVTIVGKGNVVLNGAGLGSHVFQLRNAFVNGVCDSKVARDDIVVTFKNLTISGSYKSGIMVRNDIDVTLEDVTFNGTPKWSHLQVENTYDDECADKVATITAKNVTTPKFSMEAGAGHTTYFNYENCTFGELQVTNLGGDVYVNGVKATPGTSTYTVATSEELIAKINSVADGSTIILKAGEYAVRFTNNTAFNVDNLTIVGEDGAKLSVSSSEASYGRIQGDKVTFENIRFTNGTVGAIGQATYNNCIFDGRLECASSNNAMTYANDCTMNSVHTSSDMNAGNAYFTNCTIKDASYGKKADSTITMTFTNCTIESLTSWNVNTVLKNCTVTTVNTENMKDNAITTVTEADDGFLYATTTADEDARILYSVPADYAETTLTVAEGVTNIGGYAFANNANIEKIVLPTTVTTLNDRAFRDTSASIVILNEGLENISYQAFRNATNVTEVVIPSTVTTISKEAFQNSGITSLILPANVTTIEYGGLRDMKMLETVVIKGNVDIPVYAFRACTNLKTVIIEGDDVTFGGGSRGMIFTNKENGDGSAITVYVANETVKERLLAADTAAKDYGGYKIVVGATFASNESELTKALASGKYVILANDIEATGEISIPEGVTLDGGKYTVKFVGEDYHLVKLNTGATLKNITLNNYRVRTEATVNGAVTMENVVINMDNDLTGLDISRGAGTAKLTNVVCKGTKDAAHLDPNTQVQVDYTPYGDVLLGTKWALEATSCDFGSLHGWNTTNGSDVSLTDTTYTVFRMHYWSNRTLYVDGVKTAWSESGAIPVAHDVGGCWSVQPAFK